MTNFQPFCFFLRLVIGGWTASPGQWTMSTGNPLTPSLKAQKKSTKAGMERINNIWILFSPCTLVEVSVPGKLIMICFATFTKLPSCRKISKLEKKSFVYEEGGFRKIRCRIEKIDPRSLTKTGVNSFQAAILKEKSSLRCLTKIFHSFVCPSSYHHSKSS